MKIGSLVLIALFCTTVVWAQPQESDPAISSGRIEKLSLPVAPASSDPPGINVHLVVRRETGVFWRGAAPLRETMLALRDSAQQRKVKVTLIDLRHPANQDDKSGKGGRLSPAAESKMAGELGLRYRSISALDESAVAFIAEALRHGDVYVHCMYGVNRTGFAVGRYATADRFKPDHKGLGERDWQQGVNFQQRLQR